MATIQQQKTIQNVGAAGALGEAARQLAAAAAAAAMGKIRLFVRCRSEHY